MINEIIFPVRMGKCLVKTTKLLILLLVCGWNSVNGVGDGEVANVKGKLPLDIPVASAGEAEPIIPPKPDAEKGVTNAKYLRGVLLGPKNKIFGHLLQNPVEYDVEVIFYVHGYAGQISTFMDLKNSANTKAKTNKYGGFIIKLNNEKYFNHIYSKYLHVQFVPSNGRQGDQFYFELNDFNASSVYEFRLKWGADNDKLKANKMNQNAIEILENERLLKEGWKLTNEKTAIEMLNEGMTFFVPIIKEIVNNKNQLEKEIKKEIDDKNNLSQNKTDKLEGKIQELKYNLEGKIENLEGEIKDLKKDIKGLMTFLIESKKHKESKWF